MAKNYAVYVLMRNDMSSLTPGKAMAQAHHAGVRMMTDYGSNPEIAEYTNNAHGYGTTIVLSASIEQIDAIYDAADSNFFSDWIFDKVYDPSYPFIVDGEIAYMLGYYAKTEKKLSDGRVLMVRNELTCAYFLVDRNDPAKVDLFADLDLY